MSENEATELHEQHHRVVENNKNHFLGSETYIHCVHPLSLLPGWPAKNNISLRDRRDMNRYKQNLYRTFEIDYLRLLTRVGFRIQRLYRYVISAMILTWWFTSICENCWTELFGKLLLVWYFVCLFGWIYYNYTANI